MAVAVIYLVVTKTALGKMIIGEKLTVVGITTYLMLRSEAVQDTDAGNVIGKIYNGDVVTLLKKMDDDWYYIKTAAGQTGYVHTTHLI